MKVKAIVVATGFLLAGTLSGQSECRIDCDVVQCIYGGAGHGTCFQFKNDCVVTINTSDPEGDQVSGCTPNEQRDATCTPLCDVLHIPPGVTLLGLATQCSSNEEYVVTSNCGEECLDDNCTGQPGPDCEPAG